MTYLGYFGEIVAINLGCAAYVIASGAVLLLFISICFHHQAFFKIFEHSINASKRCDKKFLFNLIRFQITARE